jgi:hypothetical protein
MAAIPLHISELIMECLTAWLAGSGRWTPTLHRYPKPILDQQIGPTILVGGLMLGAVVRTPFLYKERLTIVDTFIVRSTMAQPIRLAVEGSQTGPLEMIRLDRHPKSPAHEYVFGCASSFMSVYFGLICGDLARFGRDERVEECRGRIVPDNPPEPYTMIQCQDCGGMLFPGMIDHAWPVYRHGDMRLIHRI